MQAVVEEAVAQGATALLRGTREGDVVGPSVLTDVPADRRCCTTRPPGAVILTVDGDDQAIAPFGGQKHSGLGRRNGEQMAEAFTTTKRISVRHGRSAFPF